MLALKICLVNQKEYKVMAFDLEEWNIPRDNLLRSCFLIAAFELLRSLYFSFSSVSVMISHTNSYSILAYLSTIAWILTVVGLFVGLWKGRPTLLVFWLLFSGFATAMDIIYLIWNVTSSPVFDVDHFKHWTILYFGIFYECTGLYLVFRYFRRLYSYCLLEGGNYDWFSKDDCRKDDATETISTTSNAKTSEKTNEG
ncbi:uncharacterized protein LOC119554200 isoform X2 [Drosophila subpulchrella]|uniref:uncharacterized protein LOC119554200 isoform X2 n=1 Tax=Drosophila subpulchrella TaxID=1486046 RepID=UPI0018A132D5|nr:uncharacterized protein LOC119554200 isoform X2 [Drosophila subpulchrella]